MRPYVSAILLGFTAFAAQLILAAGSQLSGLSEKSEALAMKALSHGWESAGLFLTLAAYLLLGGLIHAAVFVFVTKVCEDVRKRGSRRAQELLSRRGAQPVYLSFAFLLMVLANQQMFPASSAVPNADLLLSQRASGLLVYGLPLVAAALLSYWLATSASRRVRWTLATTAMFGIAAWTPLSSRVDASDRKKPDVIVIGVDSLRPDHLKPYGLPGESLAPTIESLVSEGRRFDQAYTTQGRTFVAYMSILTGLYPTSHGARENLYPRALYRKDASVAHRFSREGYHTVFAMDEARFANFDREFGFDRIVSPPPGVADFMIGTLLDTVGTNLLQLLPYSDVLMPHIAGNRAAAAVYFPKAFDRRLSRAVRSADPNQPMFLLSHFCIAHVPYVFLTKREQELPAPYSDSPGRYRAAVRTADRQVHTLIETLRSAGRLDNAIVVLLSDHGEGLGMDKDGLHVPAGQRPWTSVFGHGSFALSTAESHILLSFQRYKDSKPVLTPSASQARASLVDVAPTLLAMSGIDRAPSSFDGKALLDAAGDFTPQPAARPVFMESGISGASLQKSVVNPGEVAAEFSYLYRITDDLRFELQPETLAEQLRLKQRAVLLGRYGLSSWPAQDRWLKVDFQSGVAELLPKASTDPLVGAYKPLLCSHFSRDAQFQTHWCATTAPPAVVAWEPPPRAVREEAGQFPARRLCKGSTFAVKSVCPPGEGWP